MLKDFRREAIESALQTYKANGLTRTETIEYRGISRNFEVVTISPEVPLLNPSNSRLRAQLLQHARHSIVETDPTSPESQLILSNLLGATEKFDELKRQILDFKQQEPGIISRDGLLVNGNTRLTAIRELGLTGFDVAVLPDDATNDDYFNIEMALQLRKLVHQDYTFTNELLLVDSYLKRTNNEQATISAMQWMRDGRKRLRKYQGYLQLIEEIRSINPNLTYESFDKRQDFIKQLHDEYERALEQSPGNAETLKLTRLLALFLGLNKDEIRETDEYFVAEHILENNEDEELGLFFGSYSKSLGSADALDDLLEDKPELPINLKELVEDIGAKVVDESGAINDTLVEINFKKLHSKFRREARQIREDRINSDARAEPIEYLRDVTKSVQELADRIPLLVQDAKFDKSKFQFQSRKTSKAIEALQDALKRALNE
jgi:hypothetical protein